MIDYKVLEFIKRRFPVDCNWCSGNCYWFAKILCERFTQYSIWLFPIENHFMAGDGEYFYDWKGYRNITECTEEPVLFKNLKNEDPAFYSSLVKHCIK